MNRSVQILLLAACLAPFLCPARGETMEERKQRITRKYLRERTNILQSDTTVPVVAPEDAQITDSERFKEPGVDLQRQEPGGAMMPPPPPRRPLPSAADRNWLLAEDPAPDDPFAPQGSAGEPEKQADWMAWGTERETMPYGGSETESRFDRRNYDSGSQQPDGVYDPKRQGLFNPRAPRTFSSDGTQQDTTLGGSSGLDLSRDKTLNSTLNPNRLQSPFPRDAESANDRTFGSGPQRRTGGVVPYRSPYQTPRNQQQQGAYGTPQQEFQKQDPYQKWKEKNPTRFDPTGDDAFIDELMPKTRR